MCNFINCISSVILFLVINMDIKVTERGPKAFYDEFLYIAFFVKKFIKNPNSRVHRMTHYLITNLVLLLAAFLLMLFFYLKDKDTYVLAVLCFLTFVFLFVLFYLVIMLKRISIYKKKMGEVIFSLNKTGITYKSEELGIDLKWENIKYALINKYSIVFIPSSTNYLITSIDIKYKEDIIKGLKKYKKMDLLIDNSER